MAVERKFRPSRGEIGRIKWMAFRCIFYCRKAAEPDINPFDMARYREHAEEWSNDAFALSAQVAARTQESTK